jgi:hypothetical protein
MIFFCFFQEGHLEHWKGGSAGLREQPANPLNPVDSLNHGQLSDCRGCDQGPLGSIK